MSDCDVANHWVLLLSKQPFIWEWTLRQMQVSKEKSRHNRIREFLDIDNSDLPLYLLKLHSNVSDMLYLCKADQHIMPYDLGCLVKGSFTPSVCVSEFFCRHLVSLDVNSKIASDGSRMHRKHKSR